MTRSQQLVRQLHLIASAVFGVFAVAVGLSGSALVFRDELERGFYEPRVVPGSFYLPLETLRADVTAVEPTRRISMLILPDRPDRPVQFILQKRDARTLKEADQMSVYVKALFIKVFSVKLVDWDGFHHRFPIFRTPLVDLPYSELCPGNAALQKLMNRYR